MANIGNTFRREISVIRLIKNTLMNSTIEFDAELILSNTITAQEQYNIMTSIERWFDMVVDRSVMFCPATEVPTETLSSISNNIMLTPNEPYDHHLLLLFTAKINAIGNNLVSAGHCHIISDVSDGFGNWFEGDPNEFLPSNEEWVGSHAYFDKPWWNRPDGGMIEVWAKPEDDLSKKPDILLDLLNNSDLIDENTTPAEIIKPNFKPTIVTDD